MSSKYCHIQGTNSNYVDLTEICELQVHDAVPGFEEDEETGINFVGEAFQKAGTNTQNIVLAGYNVNGSSVTFVKKGCYPTCSKSIWTSTTPGSYTISRTDVSLTIGSSTFYPADFRCNSIPHELIILTVGAGGGGGGNGYFSPGKDKAGFTKVAGGAGGGGAQIIGRLKISNEYTYYVSVGTGGAPGSDGSSSAKSAGTAGNWGEVSSVSFYDGGSYKLLWGAGGGEGGSGGIGGDDTGTAGTGGAGGAAHIIPNFNENNIHYLNTNSCSGGKGNYYQSHNNTKSAGLTFLPTSGTGATEVTVSNSRANNGTTENKDDNSNSYFSGGCSYGYGNFFSNGAFSNGGEGGGGTAGITVSAGNNGKVIIWY